MVRQIKHPTRSRNLTTPRVHFNIPSSPSPNPLDLSINITQSIPTPLKTISQQSTPNISSDYLGSTTTSEQVRENPFNPPASVSLMV